MGSPSGKINTDELVKVLKVGGWAALGAGSVAFLDVLVKWVTNTPVDGNSYLLFLSPFAVMLLKAVKEYFTSNTLK